MSTRGLTWSERQYREGRRRQAAEWFAEKVPQAEVARRLGVSRQAAHEWHQQWQDKGPEALASTGRPGQRCALSSDQLEAVRDALRQGPSAHGFTG